MSRVNNNLRIPARSKSLVRSERQYRHCSRPAALISVDLILQRGNAVRMVNRGGEFCVTELVLS